MRLFGVNKQNFCIVSLECDDPAPVNGMASSPNGRTFGELTFISCLPGYELNGEQYLTCLDGPQWSDNASCIRGIQYILIQECEICPFSKDISFLNRSVLSLKTNIASRKIVFCSSFLYDFFLVQTSQG